MSSNNEKRTPLNIRLNESISGQMPFVTKFYLFLSPLLPEKIAIIHDYIVYFNFEKMDPIIFVFPTIIIKRYNRVLCGGKSKKSNRQ